MKLTPSLLTGLLALVVCTGRGIERLPIEDFARVPDTMGARLSPDGKRLAFLREFHGLMMLHVADIETNKIMRLDVSESVGVSNSGKEVARFRWIGDRRLVATTTQNDRVFGMVAMDCDGKRLKGLFGWERDRMELGGPAWATDVLYAFNDEEQNVLTLSWPAGPNRPDIQKMSSLEGLAKTVVKNPGEVAYWGLDFEGVARFGVLSHGDLSGVIYRAGEKDGWKTILPLKDRKGQLRIVGFDRANNRIWVSMLNEQKRWAIFPLDPATGDVGAALLSDPEYDIVPDRGLPPVEGIALVSAYFSKRKEALIGMRYYTEAPRVKWFDKEYLTYQAGVDKKLPDTVNVLVDDSDNGRKQLWYAFSDQHPGAYHLLDLDKKSFTPLAPRMGWIKPAQMAPMLAIKYAARDGLVIHGYLTVPVGHQPKGLPLVVMPHGGPWVRDTWGFDPLVQLLANRGYAVLQMNYRGSPGYGDELFKSAKLQIGKQIQDDIEDGTRWAIAAGVADPQRVAILGMSYGGYSALFALGKNPELYRCGVSFAGVTDWVAIYDDSDVADYKEAKRHWREQIGDPSKDKAVLQAISPVSFADKITAPVLILQGKQDRRVPPDQAKRMIAALEKAGRKPQSLFLSEVGHNYGDQKKHAEIYKAMVDFLEKNLGPGVP